MFIYSAKIIGFFYFPENYFYTIKTLSNHKVNMIYKR